jgi:hypothetical protein
MGPIDGFVICETQWQQVFDGVKVRICSATATFTTWATFGSGDNVGRFPVVPF